MGINHVVLFSGGFDSTSLLVYLLDKIEKEEIICLNINYHQRNRPEIIRAKQICELLGVEYRNIDISSIADFIFSSSALVNKNIDVDEELKKNKQPNTYVPFRNLLFITIALSFAESIRARNVWTAIQRHELYFYWDTTEEFINKVNEIASLNNKKIKVNAPFVNLTKKEIFRLVEDHEQILRLSWSCYNPIIYDGYYYPCGKCGACKERVVFCEPCEVVDED
jgi:7-cyano-7-deazaguanine synthase